LARLILSGTLQKLVGGYAELEIFQDIWFAPIGPDSEVHLIPAIRGG
jgi:hypothetical protein